LPEPSLKATPTISNAATGRSDAHPTAFDRGI
jgi:hypothetical protein